MIDFFYNHLAFIMFSSVFILLLLGYPVAFTIGGTSLFFGLIGFGPAFFGLLPLRIWGTMTNYVLIAVPLFVYMGMMFFHLLPHIEPPHLESGRVVDTTGRKHGLLQYMVELRDFFEMSTLRLCALQRIAL